MSYSFEEIAQGLVTALQGQEEARFAAGDLILAAEGIPIRTLASAVGRSEAYLYQLRSVAEKFPPETRAQDMTWSVHRLASGTSDPQAWLERAVEGAWSVRELRHALTEAGLYKGRGKRAKTCPKCGYDLR